MVKEDNTLGVLTHILGLFTGFIAPLIMYFVIEDKKSKSFQNNRNSLNFQLSVLIYGLVATLLVFILIGIPIIIALAVLVIVTCITGAVRANEGKVYEYPLTIKFLK